MQKHNKITRKRQSFYGPFQMIITFIYIVSEFTLTLNSDICLNNHILGCFHLLCLGISYDSLGRKV